MRDYVEIADLHEIYLEDSYVLDLECRPGVIRFTVDFVLTHEHRMYRSPKPGEQYCYQRGELRFEHVARVEWTAQGALPARDATGEIDLGNIDSFRWDDESFDLEGDWGRMRITARDVRVELD